MQVFAGHWYSSILDEFSVCFIIMKKFFLMEYHECVLAI